MGDVSSLFSTIGNGIGTAASDIGQGIGTVGNDLFQGAKGLVGSIGNGIGGVLGDLGGGGPVSPGTIANTAGGVAAPAASAAGAVAPAAATSAAGFSAAPGIADAASLAPPPSLPGVFDTSVAAGVPSPGPLTGIPTDTTLAGGVGSPNFSMGGSPFLQSVLNPKTALPLGIVGLDLVKGSQDSGAIKNLKHEQAVQQGLATKNEELATAEQEGILPAGAQSLVEQTLRANEAAVRTKYAQMGMSGSSAESQDLQAARDQALAQQFQIGSGLAQQGFQNVTAETGLNADLLQAILQDETAQSTALGQALASFAAGVAH